MKSDFEIQNQVIENLAWNPLINLSELKVEVKNRVVKLWGKVDVSAQKLSAERAAKRVEDVKSVDDHIKIKFRTPRKNIIRYKLK